MRLYIKGDYTKKIPYGYLELAGKMWFPEEKQVSYSNAGDNEGDAAMIQDGIDAYKKENKE